MITITTASRYKFDKKEIKNKAEEMLKSCHFDSTDILNIIFVGKIKMKRISLRYKHENEALPVLSFSYLKSTTPSVANLIGEIFICYPQAVLLAAERGKKVDYTILSLIRHGIENIINKS